jgi:hypothetical protein
MEGAGLLGWRGRGYLGRGVGVTGVEGAGLLGWRGRGYSSGGER